jgi:hypothetical protein
MCFLSELASFRLFTSGGAAVDNVQTQNGRYFQADALLIISHSDTAAPLHSPSLYSTLVRRKSNYSE